MVSEVVDQYLLSPMFKLQDLSFEDILGYFYHWELKHCYLIEQKYQMKHILQKDKFRSLVAFQHPRKTFVQHAAWIRNEFLPSLDTVKSKKKR